MKCTDKEGSQKWVFHLFFSFLHIHCNVHIKYQPIHWLIDALMHLMIRFFYFSYYTCILTYLFIHFLLI